METSAQSSNRIVFMGTPGFASGCLRKLVESGMNIVAVVTMPDKPIGRGQKLGMSDVKKTALELGIPLLQPGKLKDPVFLEDLKSYQADLQIVVAFRMLPKEVWNMPRLGTFNLHASLLPKYRGAAPIQRAIWNGETESGVTTFLLDKDLDTGAIIYQEKITLTPEETAGSLHDKLLEIGAPLVVKTANDLLDGTVIPHPQSVKPGETIPEAPKIFKQDCILDFKQYPARFLHQQIRALSPYPGAIAQLKNLQNQEIIPIKVLEAEIVPKTSIFLPPKGISPGTMHCDGKHFLHIQCNDGSELKIKRIQIPGKKALSIEDCLRGFRIEDEKNYIFI